MTNPFEQYINELDTDTRRYPSWAYPAEPKPEQQRTAVREATKEELERIKNTPELWGFDTCEGW